MFVHDRWSFFYIFGHIRDFVRGHVDKHQQKGVRTQRHLPDLLTGLDSAQAGRAFVWSSRNCPVLLNSLGGASQKKLEYAPIRQDYEDFYTRRMYYRLHVSLV